MTYETDVVQKRIDRLFAEKPWLAKYFAKSDVQSVEVGRVDEKLLKTATSCVHTHASYSGVDSYYRSRIYLFDKSGEFIAAVGEKGGELPKTRWGRFLNFFHVYPRTQSLWERLGQLGTQERGRVDVIVDFYFNDSSLAFYKSPTDSTVTELFERCQKEQNDGVEAALASK